MHTYMRDKCGRMRNCNKDAHENEDDNKDSLNKHVDRDAYEASSTSRRKRQKYPGK